MKKEPRARIKAVIFDIDGTLADCDHRRHLVENPINKENDWPAFFKAMTDDKPKSMVIGVARHLAMSRGYQMLIVTGRPMKYKRQTADWLQLAGVTFTNLYMRPDQDFRPDHEFKREIYTQQIDPHYRVDLVVDDRASVVAMWRSLGLECWQVAEANF